MYSNKEAIGADSRDNALRSFKYGVCVGSEKQFVRSICPKCNVHHDVFMLWTGRGMPRKFCAQCRTAVAAYDDMVLSDPSISSSGFSSGRSRKRGKSVECE